MCVVIGLCAYDMMHTIFIGAIGYILEAILALLTPKSKKELDRRAKSFSPFRDPSTGVWVRRVTTVSNLAYLTAEQKVVCLSTMTCVLGHQAQIIPLRARVHVLRALSCLQIICFVTRDNGCPNDIPIMVDFNIATAINDMIVSRDMAIT